MKKGLFTSEFWLSVVTALGSIGSGIFVALEMAEKVFPDAQSIGIAGVVLAGVIGGAKAAGDYAKGRSAVKVAQIHSAEAKGEVAAGTITTTAEAAQVLGRP